MNYHEEGPGAGNTEALDSALASDSRSRPQITPDQPETLPYVEAFEASPARIEAAIDATLGYLDRGWHIHLTPWTGELPARELPAVDQGIGEPLVLWNKDTPDLEDLVRQAFDVAQDAGLIALATGPKSGVLVIRATVKLAAWFENLALKYSADLLEVTSSGDGYWNYFFKWPANVKSIPKDIWEKTIKRLFVDVLKNEAATSTNVGQAEQATKALRHLDESKIEEVEVLGDGDQLLLPPTIGEWWNDENGCSRERDIGDMPRWLGVAFGLMPPLPEIKIKADGLSEDATLGERALKNADVAIYKRSGALVYPIVTEVEASRKRRTKTAKLEKIEAPFLRDQLRQVADWLRWDKKAEAWLPCNPKTETAVTILARKNRWTFPAIAGVITTQTMRPDGSLLLLPGFDKATRLLLLDPIELPPMPERPTRDDALASLALLEDLLSEFRFVEDDGVGYAVALSALVTPVVRGAFDVAPMHVARAPVMSSGKSYLFDIAAAIATGQHAMPVISPGANEEELEKRLGAALLSGQPLISIDNVVGELKGVTLCQAIERPIVEIRILGRSELVSIETKGTTIYCTGNNVVIVGDLIRRTITTSLDPQMERPELRKFKDKPVDKVLADRGAYIAACLTICRAYIVAVENEKLKKADPLASFAGWSDIVRSALCWLGKADPVRSMEIARENDPELGALRDMLTAWSKTIGVGKRYEVTLADVIAKIAKRTAGYDSPLRYPELNDVIQAVAGKPRVLADAIILSRWLRMNKGRVVTIDGVDLRFASKARGGAAMWWIEASNGQVSDDSGTWWDVEPADDPRPEPPPAEPDDRDDDEPS